MKTKNTDVVAEYLHEVDVRLAGLPVLQRRELLADLAAHIAAERAERNLAGEGELIEVLERLGSPDVVAAAAYEEAGVRPIAAPKSPQWWTRWPAVAVAAVVGMVLVLAVCLGMVVQGRSAGPVPEQVPAPVVVPPSR